MTTYDSRPALFLDLDGTIRYNKYDPGCFIDSIDQVAIFDGVEEKLWSYRDKGFLIFGHSNQGGIAYGYKDYEKTVEEIEGTRAMFDLDPFHEIVFCPYHPGGSVQEYSQPSTNRKPDTGMITMLVEKARENGVEIDLDRSIVVGDRPEDEIMAKRASIPFQWADDFFERA